MDKKLVAIVGSYRKGRITDTAVDAVIEGAVTRGAKAEKIYLLDKDIEFCENCRKCASEPLGPVRGQCVHCDDMAEILDKIDSADYVVLASPVNFFTVTALMKRFVERLIVYGYWPWGKKVPAMRIKHATKRAVVITSSACPTLVARLMMRNSVRVLNAAAACVGSRVVKTLYYGGVGQSENQQLIRSQLVAAFKAGQKLVG